MFICRITQLKEDVTTAAQKKCAPHKYYKAVHYNVPLFFGAHGGLSFFENFECKKFTHNSVLKELTDYLTEV